MMEIGLSLRQTSVLFFVRKRKVDRNPIAVRGEGHSVLHLGRRNTEEPNHVSVLLPTDPQDGLLQKEQSKLF
jgi:hypothetical protein